MLRGKIAIEGAHLALCGALTDIGCTYDIHTDNRGGGRSRYIFARKPVAFKVRVSDHGSDRVKKDAAHSRVPIFDVRTDGRGLTVQEAITAISALVAE